MSIASERIVPLPLAAQAATSPQTAFSPLSNPVSTPPAAAERGALDAYGKLPAFFVANAGQADPRVRYYAQGARYGFAFTRGEAILSFVKGKRGAALALRFLGSRAQAEPEGARQLPGKLNYLLGNDPAKWQTGLRTYGEVRYRNLWPGVDMVFRGGKGRLKYEFVLRPGARVQDVRLGYRGAKRLSLNRRGNLLIGTSLGVLTDTRPLSYQVIGGKRVPVESRFVVGHAGAYGFAIGAYDPRRPLVIDPGLVYSTYLGGSGFDRGDDIAIDSMGSAYVTGQTSLAANFPTTPGAFDTTHNFRHEAFVTKLNPLGTGLVYSTFLGGTEFFDSDQGLGIAVDAAGSAYVTGITGAANFPTTPGAFDTSFNGFFFDAFVTKLNPLGTGLVYSTYLGGADFEHERGLGIALDGAGSASVTGVTGAANFPTTPGAFDTSFNGSADAFVTKLNPLGTGLVYSSYLGGNGRDQGGGIALDAAGGASVTGLTRSGNFPTTPGAFDTSFNGVNDDAYVTKLNPLGTGLVYSTYLGGGGTDDGRGIALDAAGSAYVTGSTDSANFPTTPGAFDTTFNGGSADAYVTKLNPLGTGLVYSTYLGGNRTDLGDDIAVDGAGSAYVTGSTDSANFPTTPGAFDMSFNGVFFDAFVTKLNPLGTDLAYSTYLGGSDSVDGGDSGLGIALDAAGSVYVTGQTASGDFPTTPGAFDTSFNGPPAFDAFVTKLDLGGTPATLTLAPPAETNAVGTPHTVTATVRDAGANPVSGVTVRFSVTGANGASGVDVTDANGEATFTYTGTVAGLDAISAFADTDNDGTQDLGEPSGAATKLWTPGAPATLTLEPESDTNRAGEEHCVTATVRDQLGNPVPGVIVDFDVSGANPRAGAAVTDANGRASFCYTGTVAGTDTISATAQGGSNPSDTATKVYDPGAPASLTLEPAADINTVGNPHTVTATVRDAFANPVPGILIGFSVTGANSASGSDVTDANGEATFAYTGTTAGADTITATVLSEPDGPSATATKTWIPGAPATLTLEPETDTNTVDEEHCVTATVRDAFGNPTPGIVVRFSVSGANTASGSATTDANGQATFCYTGVFPGVDTISAYADTDGDDVQDAGEPSDTASKVWLLPASSCGEVEGEGRLSTNSRASFELGVENEGDEGPEGKVSYRDRAVGLTFRSTGIDALVISGNGASIFGQGKANGTDVQFRVDVTDGPDTFTIQLSNGYTATGNVRDGGVEIEQGDCEDGDGDDDD